MRRQLNNEHFPGVMYQLKVNACGEQSLPYVSHTVETYTGLSPNTVMENIDRLFSLTHPDDLPGLEASITESLENLTHWEWKGRFICNEDDVRWFHGLSVPVKQQDGDILWNGVIIDITEHERRFFKGALDQTLDCVFMIDALSLRFLYVNERARQQTGYVSEELLLMHPYDINPDHSEAQIRKMITPLLTGEKTSLNFKTLHQHKNGQLIPVEVLLRYILPGDESARFVAIVRDITERELMEAELDGYRGVLETLVDERTAELVAARNEAERANAYKSIFLSRMSHELRTPMNAILGFAQILELDAEGFSETQRGNVKEILEAGNHLLSLINEVLDLAKIESGKMEISMEKVDVGELLQQSISLVQHQASIRQLEIIDHISSEGYTVMADFIRLKQVLLNLLNNAAKYNCQYGRITLHSEIIDKQRLRIYITDTGQGMEGEEIARLFTPFERLGSTKKIEGTGMGLVISKNLIELMGGAIGVESTLSAGSSFWVELALSGDA